MRILVFILAVLLPLALHSETVYRFQDEHGRWHFTDKKPKREHETLELVRQTKQKIVPELIWGKSQNTKQLLATNPLFLPVQFELYNGKRSIANWVVEARSNKPVLINSKPVTEWQDSYEYRYRLGRPITRSDGAPLQPPVPRLGEFLISQGFNGPFSHQEEPNLHAVDIAMNMSDHIHAARDGIVVEVKDDYHMGGTNSFFLDKANYISIVHRDDTYAVYAHILLGSAKVEVGQRVKAGDPLANAGTSGYSTGPHLHFVLRANNGHREVSMPFQFKVGNAILRPEARQWLTNPLKPKNRG